MTKSFLLIDSYVKVNQRVMSGLLVLNQHFMQYFDIYFQPQFELLANNNPLFKFLDFLFENEVLGYNGGISKI